MKPKLSEKGRQDLAVVRDVFGERVRGPFVESDGSWAVSFVRRVQLPRGLIDERREECLGETPEAALERARAIADEELLLATGDVHAAG